VNQDILAGRYHASDAFPRRDIEYMSGLYDGGIAYEDALLGQLFAHLEATGLWDKTIVIVTADHGEELGEHGLFLHSQNYEEVARVPLLVHFPRGRFAGQRVSALLSTLEVMPTILDLVGVAPNKEVMGKSALPLLEGGREGRPWVYMASALEKLRTPQWSLLVAKTGPALLYDLAHDPGETANVLPLHAADAASLYAIYQRERSSELRLWHQQLLASPEAMSHLTRSDYQRLESLGYLP
jgi:choline-sulfatase